MAVSVTESVQVTVLMGCAHATLTAPTNPPLSFSDLQLEIFESGQWTYDASLLFDIDTLLDCAPQVTWWSEKDGAAFDFLDLAVFTEMPASGLTAATVDIYTEDVSKAGIYVISYSVRLDNYPQSIEYHNSYAFTVTIIDTCTTQVITVTQPPALPIYYYGDPEIIIDFSGNIQSTKSSQCFNKYSVNLVDPVTLVDIGGGINSI